MLVTSSPNSMSYCSSASTQAPDIKFHKWKILNSQKLFRSFFTGFFTGFKISKPLNRALFTWSQPVKKREKSLFNTTCEKSISFTEEHCSRKSLLV